MPDYLLNGGSRMHLSPEMFADDLEAIDEWYKRFSENESPLGTFPGFGNDLDDEDIAVTDAEGTKTFSVAYCVIIGQAGEYDVHEPHYFGRPLREDGSTKLGGEGLIRAQTLDRLLLLDSFAAHTAPYGRAIFMTNGRHDDEHFVRTVRQPTIMV